MKNRIIFVGSVIFMALIFVITFVGCDGLFGNKNPIKIPTKAELVGFQTEFDLGDDFSLGGGVVTVTYSNGDVVSYTEANLDEINIIVDSGDFDSSEVEKFTITVKSTKYKQINTTYEVHVIDPAETVSMPIPNPNGGAYEIGHTVNVALSCRRAADDGSEIWYTLDKSTPAKDGANSTLYTGTAITITESTTIKAKAYTDDGRTPSSVMETKFVFAELPDEE